MVKKIHIKASIVTLFMLLTQTSCEKSDGGFANEGYIRDIKTLQAIKQANPHSSLNWDFCFDDPRNPIISNYGEDSSQTDIKFGYIEGEQRVTELNIPRKNISQLENLQLFSELKVLHCQANEIDSLDVSKNYNLITLVCSFNQFNSLDVSKNENLSWLDCNTNQLRGLDVSKNKELIWLDCSSNLINSLDVSENKKLFCLICHSNSINSLDVSENNRLNTLDCHSNQISSLDISKNKALSTLDCHSNLLNSLDVSKNKEFTWLDCSSNPCSTEERNRVVILNQFYDKAQSLSIYDEFYLKPAKSQENEKIYSVVNE